MFSIHSRFATFSPAAWARWKATNKIPLSRLGIFRYGQKRWGVTSHRVEVFVQEKKIFQTKHIRYGFDHLTGALYLDATRRWIWFKLTLTTLWRPLFTVVQTVYRLTLLHLVITLARDYQKKRGCKTMRNHAVRSLVDIVRFPMYGIALTAITGTGMLLGPLFPALLYSCRNAAGRIENHLLWGEKRWRDVTHTMAPCLQPRHYVADMANCYPDCSPVVSYTKKLKAMIQNDHFPNEEVASVIPEIPSPGGSR